MSHIRFCEGFMTIKVDKSKTGQLRQGDEVVIAQSEGNVCPVFLLKEHGRWKSVAAKDGYVKDKIKIFRTFVSFLFGVQSSSIRFLLGCCVMYLRCSAETVKINLMVFLIHVVLHNGADMEFPVFEWIRIARNEIFLCHGSSGDWGS